MSKYPIQQITDDLLLCRWETSKAFAGFSVFAQEKISGNSKHIELLAKIHVRVVSMVLRL